MSPAPISKRRSIRTHLLGMIWNANHVLEEALNPKSKRIPTELFKKCHGIVLLTMTKASFLLSGYCGTGVMMAKKNFEKGEWSPPVAVYNGGYGFGATAGKKTENVLIFIMDDASMEDFVTRPQTRIGVVAAMTLCKMGGESSQGMELPNKGTITYSFTKGAFAGLSLEMGTLETLQAKQNRKFYGNKASPAEILFEEGAVEIPQDSLIPDIHKKLGQLAAGETWVAGDEDFRKSTNAREQAIQAEHELKIQNKN